MNKTAVSLRKIVKRFGEVAAVDDVSLDIGEGEFVTLLGPSGCGKTTLLRIIAGFEQPDEGTVLLASDDVTDVPPHRRDVHTVFQQYALFPHLTVAGNVAFGLRRRGLRGAQLVKRVADALELVRLPTMGDRYPAQLSGGQQQRVAIARAVVLEPRVLLLDEPLGALDRKLREEMQTELKRLQRTLGIAFVFVTHDQDEALAMSDRVVVMNMGRVEQTGSPREIYDRPATRFVAGFVGVTNVFLEDGRAVAVRPERIRFVEPSTGETVTGTVEDARYLGDVTHWAVRLDDGTAWTVFARGEDAQLEPGRRVGLTWDPEHAVHLEQ